MEELDRPERFAEVEVGFCEVLEEVFEVDHADEFVELPVGDGVKTVRVAVDPFANLVGRHGDVDPDDFTAGRHHRVDRAVAERKDASYDLLFDHAHFAVVDALLDDRTDLLLRYLVVRLFEAQQSGDRRGAARKQPYERRGRHRECTHRPRDGAGDLLGRVHADTLGNEFAEDERQVGDDDDDRHLGRDRRRAQGNTQQSEFTAEFRSQRIAGVDTREDADERDADLDGREELVGILDDPERALRAGVSLPGTQFEVGTAGRDQCDFRHGEDAVEQDQQDDDDDFQIECLRYVPYVGRCPDARAGSCACAGASAVRCGSVSFCKDTKSRAQKQTHV